MTNQVSTSFVRVNILPVDGDFCCLLINFQTVLTQIRPNVLSYIPGPLIFLLSIYTLPGYSNMLTLFTVKEFFI